MADVFAAVGQEVNVREWVDIDQARIDGFAHTTADFQWTHVDAERATRMTWTQTASTERGIPLGGRKRGEVISELADRQIGAGRWLDVTSLA